MSGSVEIHDYDDWSAVYLDGVLQRVGDTYLADEWVREHFGVTTVQDNAFMRGQNGRDGVAQTLDEVYDYQRRRDENIAKGAELRAEASRLLAEAAELDRAAQ